MSFGYEKIPLLNISTTQKKEGGKGIFQYSQIKNLKSEHRRSQRLNLCSTF